MDLGHHCERKEERVLSKNSGCSHFFEGSKEGFEIRGLERGYRRVHLVAMNPLYLWLEGKRDYICSIW